MVDSISEIRLAITSVGPETRKEFDASETYLM